MSQISPYLVNCGLSSSVLPLSNALAFPVAIGARISVVRPLVVAARSVFVTDTASALTGYLL
jgi:hypothetical protein